MCSFKIGLTVNSCISMHINCYMFIHKLPGSFQFCHLHEELLSALVCVACYRMHWVRYTTEQKPFKRVSLPDFVLFCRVHQMLCSFTSCQTMMGTGAFFQHCHSKTHKHTQHNTECTPPLDLTELRVFIHKVVLNTFTHLYVLFFLSSALPHNTVKHLRGLCFWKKRPTWTYITFCRCWANSRQERWAADFSVFQLLLLQQCNIAALEILCHFNFRHPIISSCEEALRGLSSHKLFLNCVKCYLYCFSPL